MAAIEQIIATGSLSLGRNITGSLTIPATTGNLDLTELADTLASIGICDEDYDPFTITLSSIVTDIDAFIEAIRTSSGHSYFTDIVTDEDDTLTTNDDDTIIAKTIIKEL